MTPDISHADGIGIGRTQPTGVTVSAQPTDRTNSPPEPKSGGKPARKKFGLVLQGAAALGAYEVGAIEYLYESGMECAIVSGASSGAMNAATLAGARGYPPQLLRELWDMLTVKPPVPFLLLVHLLQDADEPGVAAGGVAV
jgi:hypothetical protein